MRVLLAHDYYRSSAPSGEDAVFRNERNMLEQRGHEVTVFERFNDDIDDTSLNKRIRLAQSGAWSRDSYTELSALIRRTRPEIAHFHNTFPLISPSGYAACRDSGVPVVQTLHNYRLICPGALLQRDGHPCEDCVGTTLLPALVHRCYRGSLPATAALVWMLARNRWTGTYRTLVNRYIALTGFAADRLIAGGLPRERLAVKPNFLPDPPAPGSGAGGYAVYTGRLSAEKGVRTLLEAWKALGHIKLKILGDGPLRQELESTARNTGLNVEFLGFLPRDRILEEIGQAVLQVVPSEWYEGFPMVILEAYACGTPVVAARIGSLDEIVIDGITGKKFSPRDPDDLAKCVSEFHALALDNSELRGKVRARFDKMYGVEQNHDMLIDIYRQAMADTARGQ